MLNDIMHCPKCGLAESKVIDTREAQDGSFIKRRRACSSCGYRFSTIEKIEFEFPYVVKRNGSIVEFDCDKIKKSLCKAMDKELCSDRIINGMLSKILSRIVDLRTEKVESQFIGQVIMDELKCTYPVAYIRFASVYKNFKSTEEFTSECQLLNLDENY